MVSVQQLSMLYGSRLLYDDVNLILNSGNRYGLVGANGTGKSTFMRILAGEETASLGEVTIPKRATLGWLKQDQFKYENNTLLEVVLQGKPKLWQAMQEKEQLLAKDTFDEKDGYRLGALEEIIIHQDGYTAELLAAKLLTGLGIGANRHQKPLSLLSGGFKLRVLLAQALFEEPDILLLDEPTNHLDIMSISWLEQYLKNEFKGVLVFISHDQDFLNNLSTHILDIDFGEIREYVGNYDRYSNEKKQVVDQKLSERQYLEKKIAHMRVFIERFRAKASRAKQSQSREKQLEKIDLPEIKTSSRVSPAFHFQKKRPSGKMVVTVDGIYKSFEEKSVLSNVRFSINRGEKIAIVGHNGIGKSTLLKVMLGQIAADKGTYQWGHETHISYFAQDHHELLREKSTLYDWLCNQVPTESTDSIRKTLGQVLFTKDDVFKDVLNISGGEAARLLFASIILQKGNVLVLDEPTNHLDLDARMALASALREFDGTVVLVSHDRHFVSEIATRVLAFTEKGLTDFHGNYHEYLKKYGEDYLNRSWLLSQT